MEKQNRKQKGFTLVELMISIALGLLIVAAGLSLFINGLKGSKMQEGVLQVQDSGIFGLEYIADHVRLANYANVENRTLNEQTPFGGVVLSTGLAGSNVNLAVGNVNATAAFATNVLTQSSGTANADWKGASNTDVGSDQLTIQFVAPKNMHNCEGAEVRKGDLVVQRYFVREDKTRTSYDSNLPKLSLACDANTPTIAANPVQAKPAVLTGFSANNEGEIILQDIDYFGFLLGARTKNSFQYYTVQQYRNAVKTAREASSTPIIPSIEVIKMAVLIRSPEEVKFSDFDPSVPFTILGSTVKLKSPVTTSKTNRFARRVYVKTIAIRNALGDRL